MLFLRRESRGYVFLSFKKTGEFSIPSSISTGKSAVLDCSFNKCWNGRLFASVIDNLEVSINDFGRGSVFGNYLSCMLLWW
jgi:hypothetical protein